MKRPLGWKAGAGIVVLAGLVVLVVILANPVAPPGNGEAPTRPDEPGSPDEGLAAPDHEPETPGESARSGPGEDGRPLAETEASYRLVGVVTGIDPTLPGETAVEVRAVSTSYGRSPAPVNGAAGREGRIDLDVSRLFPENFEPDELEIRVNHPAYLPVRHRVRVDGDAVIRVEIPMHPAALLRGRVLDSAGVPVAGATVSAHAVASGAVAEVPTDVATTGEDGSYRVRAIPDPARHLLVAWSPERAPDGRIVEASAAAERPVEDLVLPEGSSITGRVVAFDRPVAGAVLRMGPWPQEGRLIVNEILLVWDGSRVRKASFRAVTAADGSFRLAGLAGVDHELTVTDVPGVRMHSGFSQALRREIRPPAEDVELDVTGARVVLRVESGDVTLDEFWIALEGGGLSVARGGRGATLLLAPEKALELTVFGNGCLPSKVTVEAPAKGGQVDLTVPLVEKPPSPTLVVTFRVEEEAPPVTRAGFGLFPAGTERGPMPGWFKNVTSAGRDGRFRLEDLPVGRFVLEARPGTSWFETKGHFLFAVAEVDLQAGVESEVVLDAKLGGRLRIAARDKDGVFLNADCRVLTEDGQVVSTTFVAQDPSSSSFGAGGLAGSVPNEVNPPLLPGKVRVELEMEGRHPTSVAAEVRKGRTTEVRVVLEKR